MVYHQSGRLLFYQRMRSTYVIPPSYNVNGSGWYALLTGELVHCTAWAVPWFGIVYAAVLTMKDVQAFLGFSNFYRQFVEWFSQCTSLLIELTKREQYNTKSGKKQIKYHMFEWTKACKKAFKDLKHAFIMAPVLAHYDAILKTWVETDFSDFVTAGVFSQIHNSVLRPVAFFFEKDITSGVQLYDLWQGAVSYCQEFQNIEARACQCEPACEGVHWSQKLWAFHDYKATESTTGSLGQISIGIQL